MIFLLINILYLLIYVFNQIQIINIYLYKIRKNATTTKLSN